MNKIERLARIVNKSKEIDSLLREHCKETSCTECRLSELKNCKSVNEIALMENITRNKTWLEWINIFGDEGYIIMDDDGGRKLHKEGRIHDLISESEARDLLNICTIMFNCAIK